MKQFQLGHSPLQVSALCLGCMYFGTTVDEVTAFALLDQFVESGGTFLDTANCYSFWVPGGSGDESELLLGRWLRARDNRQHIVLATKVGSRLMFAGGSWPRDAEGMSAAVIEQQIEAIAKKKAEASKNRGK